MFYLWFYCTAQTMPKYGFSLTCISSVIRQKGESQNGCHKKTKQVKFSNKWTFLTPVVRTRSLQKIWRDMVCLGRRGSVLVKPTIISFSHIKKFAISCNLPQKKNCIGAPMCKITMCKICSKSTITTMTLVWSLYC